MVCKMVVTASRPVPPTYNFSSSRAAISYSMATYPRRLLSDDKTDCFTPNMEIHMRKGKKKKRKEKIILSLQYEK